MSEDPADDDRDEPPESPDGDDLPAFPGSGADVPDVPAGRTPPDGFPDPDAVDDVPTVSCTRCGREWDLEYELDELSAGNRAVEQFAIDHERHTGHYPDGVTPWVVDCLNCPDGSRFLAERPARRFARTHARHTGHSVELTKPNANDVEQVRE